MPQGRTYVSTDPNAGQPALPPVTAMSAHTPTRQYVSTDPTAGQPTGDPRARVGQMGLDVLAGAGKGLLSTIQSGGQMIRRAIPALDRGPEVNIPVNLEPTNTAQSVGKFAERTAEFMAPAGLIGKAKTALKTGSGILDALIGAGIEAGSAGAVGTVQTGSLKEGAKTAAVAGGSSLALHGLFKAVGAMGAKAETALIKPSQADVRDGFKVENVFKHQLGGSLGQTFEKTNAKLKGLSTELQTALKSQPGAQVDIYKVFSDTADELVKDSAKNFGQNASIQRALQRISSEIDTAIGGPQSTGSTDLLTANQMKQATGRLGAWFHAPGGVVADPDAVAMERVANAFYAQLKTAIDAAVPGGRINAINRQISELIPIERAVLRRLPVEARSNVVGLGDMLGVVRGGPEGLALSMGNRLAKSGTVANAAFQAGPKAPQLSAGMARILAGLTPTEKR